MRELLYRGVPQEGVGIGEQLQQTREIVLGLQGAEGLQADSSLSKRLGYKGRTIIHPSHVEIVNQIYTPSAAEREHYRGLLEAFASATAAGRGSARYRGRMIDQAQATRARQVLDLAEAFGVDP